jgi:hypothetical protein
MKTLIIPLLAGLVLSCAQAPAQKLEFNQQINKDFSLSKEAGSSVLAIYNINGFIKVEGYSGNKIVIEVAETISAKDAQTLEVGKQEFKLQFSQNADSVVAYIAEPFDSRPKQNRNNSHKIDYQYKLDFTVKVPYQMNLHLSTVNGGNLTIKDVSGTLKALNVNGAIRLTNVKGATEARTINGNVEANYLANPPEMSSYYTLNGDIKIDYPANLSADLKFETFNGNVYIKKQS